MKFYLEEWREFSDGGNKDDTLRTITTSFGDGFVHVFRFVSNERFMMHLFNTQKYFLL